jgi:hypothetical protein
LKQTTLFYIFIIVFCFNASHSFAQEESLPIPAPSSDNTPAKKINYLLSPRVSVTVPHPMGNKSFKKSFVGIYEVSAGLNLYLYKGLFLGVTGKNGLLKITENKIADYNASMSINNAGVKLGADWYVGEKNKTIFSFAFTAGQNWTKYSGIKHIDNSPSPLINGFTTNYYEPEMNIFFLIEANFGIGATVSYTVFDANFNPYDLSLNQYTQFSTKNGTSTQFLSFGFGFYYSLIPKKK